MNHTRIVIGLAAWFLGIIVPVYHHTVIYTAAMEQGNIDYLRSIRYTFALLPIPDWIYLAAMSLVGLILVISGMKAQTVANTDK
ncbi:MAG: hypothetical protein ACF8OB_12680 [Phycisphaeraceae bacterium JB051]